MNIQQFAALKLGDKIENPATGSIGEVVEVKDAGVYVVWGKTIPLTVDRRFFYSAVGTAWFNWDVVKS